MNYVQNHISAQNGFDGDILIYVWGHDMEGDIFNVPRLQHLSVLKQAFSEMVNVPMEFLKFTYKQVEINDTDTPAQLRMTNLDDIQVFLVVE